MCMEGSDNIVGRNPHGNGNIRRDIIVYDKTGGCARACSGICGCAGVRVR